MLKFQCSHCGGRLALQERHLGRLVHCPECNGITHPMAGEILARQKVKEKLDCENCGQTLGKLQRPRRWHQSTVCMPCYRSLRLEEGARDEMRAPRRSIAAPRPRVLVSGSVENKPLHRPRLLTVLSHGPTEEHDRQLSTELSPDFRAMLQSFASGIILFGAALIVLMYVVRTIGSLLLWSAAAAAVILAAVLVSRAYFALKRRFASGVQENPSAGVKLLGRTLVRRVLHLPTSHPTASSAFSSAVK